MMTIALLTLGLITAAPQDAASAEPDTAPQVEAQAAETDTADAEAPEPESAEVRTDSQLEPEADPEVDPAADPAADTTVEARSPFEQACAREVEELHQFFHDWFVGELPNTDEAFDRFAAVMHEDFVIISPSAAVTKREDLLPRLREAHGSGAEAGIKIWIRGFKIRHVVGDIAVANYEEWQENRGQKVGRVSTAILKRADGTPNGVTWLHQHQTALPKRGVSLN